jgi:N-acetylmuramoyl-L-alanine amidase
MMKMRFLIPLIIFILLVSVFAGTSVLADYNLILGNRVLREGDEGADVAILQQKLADLSLYNGPIDGLYGSATKKAVKTLQKKYGLTVDGVAGEQTFQVLPKENLVSRMDISREDILLLARIIHGEARGESFKGKVAVGAVVLNRVESKRFPDSIREVILQKGQFSCLIDGQAHYYPSEESINAAKAALLGYDPTYGSLYFYNPKVATNLTWISSRPVTVRIGNHLFAR